MRAPWGGEIRKAGLIGVPCVMMALWVRFGFVACLMEESGAREVGGRTEPEDAGEDGEIHGCWRVWECVRGS